MMPKNSLKFDKPVFIVGTGRCGTTLMRLLLNSTKELIIGPETDFVVSILNDIPEWMWKRFRHEQLIRQRAPFYERELKDYGFTKEFFIDLIQQSPTRASFIRNFYETYAKENGFERWGENTPQNFQVAKQILHIYPQAKFLHLIRDARDVGISYVNKNFGPDDFETAAYLWRWRVAMLTRLIHRYPHHFLTIRYEDFISHPEVYVDQITDFLELSRSSIKLEDYFQNNRGVYDERIRSKIDSENIELWRTRMSEKESEFVVNICGKYMKRYGYVNSYSLSSYIQGLPVVWRRSLEFFGLRKIKMFILLKQLLEKQKYRGSKE